ncbi:MAG: DUF5671 domain-containing protein [Candidatus Paceibacterota bacterium]
MPPKQNLSPKSFFIQIGIIATLYASALSFLTFVFNLLDKVFPDNALYMTDSYSYSMRYAISFLIVVFPLFIFLSHIYRKDSAQATDKEKNLRKWLLYFTLFITGVALAIDVIVLLNSFLSGMDITLRFILKVLSVIVVCASIFIFYLKDIKGKWEQNEKGVKIFTYAVSSVILISIVTGFIYIGSPTQNRKINTDSQRVNDLSSIQWQVVNFYQAKGKLPQTLDETKDPISGSVIPLDPETKTPYEYKTTGALSFELCSVFSSESTQNQTGKIYPAYPDSTLENWKHGIGRTCFNRTIDPQRYPQINNTKTIQ